MPTYRYKAVSGDGQAVTGTLQAENQSVALSMLDEQSLFPVSVAEGGGAAESAISGHKKKVRLRHQTMFYSQLSDLLKAGVPLLRSLDVLIRQRTSAVLTEVLKEVRDEVSGGNTLADTMAKHPNAFAQLHVTMIRAGESGGFLEDVLARIAVFAERQDELRNKLIGSMVYPCMLLFAGTGVVASLLTFVVPELRKHLREETYVLPTRILFGVTDFLAAWYPLLLMLMGALTVLLYVYMRTEAGQLAFARFRLKAPVMGKIVTMVAICRFCRILGTLLRNGVPILQSLEISKDSAGNRLLSAEIARAAENVQQGETLSKPLAASGLFPLDVVDMMAVAEESNTLDNVLIQIAETNENRTARAIDLGVRMLEPVLLLIMAVVVLFIALALLLPILTMTTSGVGP